MHMRWLTLGVICTALAFCGLTSILRGASGFAMPAPVSQRENREVVTISATVRPKKTFKISPRVNGQVTELLAEEGNQVHAGQIVARLDPTIHELKLQRAIARCDHAKALLAQEEFSQANLERRLQEAITGQSTATALRDCFRCKLARFKALANSAKVSNVLVDEVEDEVRKAEDDVLKANCAVGSCRESSRIHRVSAARAEYAEAQAERDLTKLGLDWTQIRAPFDGTILACQATVGANVGPMPSENASCLYEMANLHELEAVGNIPVPFRSQVAIGTQCNLRMNEAVNVMLKGRVAAIGFSLSSTDAGLPVRVGIEVPPEHPAVIPGSLVQVEIVIKH